MNIRQADLLFTICQNIPDAICIIDTEWNIQSWNSGAQEMLGYREDELIGRSFALIIPEDIAQSEMEHCVKELTTKGKMSHYETVRRAKDGRIIPVELTAILLKEGDFVAGYAAVMRDISGRRKAEEALKLMQFSVEHASVCVYTVARDAHFLYINEQTCRTLGYTRDELLSMAVYDIDPDFPFSVWDDHWKELKQKGGLHFETKHRKKDGTLIPVEIALNYVSFAGQEYNIGFGMDISERKKTEQELAKLNRRNELILESAGEGIFGMDSRGNHIFINRAGRNVLGYEAVDLIGKHSHAIWHHTRADGTPYPENECRIYQTARDAVSRHVDDEVFWKKDGTSIPVEYMTTPIYEGKAIVGTAVTFRDITERKRAQEALQRAYAVLEEKVADRTRELKKINDELRMEVDERRRAVELIRKSKELSDALNRLDTVIHLTLDFDGIMQRIVEEAALALRVDATMIGVFEEELFHVRYVYNMPEKFYRQNLTSSELRAIHYAAEAKDALAFNDAFHDERLNTRFTREMGIQSLVVAPLFIKKKIAGALAFYGLARRIRFQEEHIDFARKLAASISLALENAKLYQALRERERWSKSVLNSIPDMAWLKDGECRFILVNEPFSRACGRSPENVAGKTDFDVWPAKLAERYTADDREVMRLNERKQVEEPLTEKNGAIRWIETIKTPIHNEQGAVVGTVGIARDITRRKQMEDEIRHMAQHDALTGLPNRRLFVDILNVELAQARRHKSRLAVLFLDLDRFKEVNDSLGHAAGDRLLKQVAERLRGTIRESDTVARIGGDEFNMVLSDIGRTEDVSDVAQKIVASLQKPIVLDINELNITTSVGISIFPDDSDDSEALLRYADRAMYHAKESGRNTFRFYNPSINVSSFERAKLESYLRQSIRRDELFVLYQPQIDIRTGKMSHTEALVRWKHPDRGILEPKDFIPLAEDTGFIAEIDEWVLRTACLQTVRWKLAGLDSFRVTVNLSARQLQSAELSKMIALILKETGMPPQSLNLELSENTAMNDVELSASRFKELEQMGVHISLDDFGTGYSSLQYLKKLPIESIKIDKSFVLHIAGDPDDRAMINAVTSMAHQMGIRTVAAGVETREQLELLRLADCDEAQGYFFCRPVPEDRLSEMIASDNP